MQPLLSGECLRSEYESGSEDRFVFLLVNHVNEELSISKFSKSHPEADGWTAEYCPGSIGTYTATVIAQRESGQVDVVESIEFEVLLALLNNLEELEEFAESERGLEVLKSEGPQIVVRRPLEDVPLSSPVAIDIEFSAEEDRRIDLDTFALKVKKLLWFDVTDRVRPYVTNQGIFVESADLGGNEGKFRVRMYLGYEDGGMTITETVWRIGKN
jgi:hypothetical protein